MAVPIDDRKFAIALSTKSAEKGDSKKQIPEGTIIKITSMNEFGAFTFSEVELHRIMSTTCRGLHCSDIKDILFISRELFPLAVSIQHPKQRINFCTSDERKEFVFKLKNGDPVKIPQGSFSQANERLYRAFVKRKGFMEGVGPGIHFIVTLMIDERRDWCPIPTHEKLEQLISKYELDEYNVILSPEYIYSPHVEVCPDVELFHLYRPAALPPRRPRIMYTNGEGFIKLTKPQAFSKRNASSSVFDAPNNKNASKTTVPDKPFNFDGKDIYVIDPPSDTDNADVRIVRSDPYEDRSSSGRTKSSNILDHLNNDSRNANRDVSPHSKYSSPRQPRESYPNYDNDVNHAADVEEPPELFTKIPGSTLGIDAMVTVVTGTCDPLNGVIRAIFKIGSIVMVGVELEDFISYVPLNLTDGTFSGHSFFECQNGKALFIEAECCHKDNRFSDDFVVENKIFGHPESPVVTEDIPPISLRNLQELEEIIGESKGIQGHHNSCYLDATLFSMFTFARCFDSLLYRHADKKDIKEYDEVRAILRDEIVHPLRKHHFVRADRVLKLRVLLENISKMTGLTNEEKDPEEFMNILMAQTLRAEPYLKFNSGQDSFYYQLFVEKNDDLKLPNVQQLFEQSFKTSNIKLREVPPCLILQMPRFGKSYKMYPRIIPSQILDITDVVEGQPPACGICGSLAKCQCLDCTRDYCHTCYQQQHQHHNQHHKAIDIRTDFPTVLNQYQAVPRIHMDLFAVVCIETSHYVSFVKAGELPDAPWLFFDSMSDRRGGQNGYNIPSMVSVPDLPLWLSEDGARKIHDTIPKDKLLPPFAKRLLCDAYMCMYVSRDVSMYK